MQEEMQQSESGSCKEKSILQSKPKSKPNDPFVNKAIAVINENIANYEFGKEEFAAAMNVSSSLLYKRLSGFSSLSIFSRAFKKHFGKTPTEI